MYKLLLVNPIEKKKKTGLGAYHSSSCAPLALAYIAALTPSEKFQVRILDENVEPMDYADVDLVGITSYTAQINRAYEIAGKFSSRNIPVVMGGIHVSMMPDEALQYCPAVVIGEAEGVWSKVLEDFEQGRLQGKYEGAPIALKDLPIPDRSLLKQDQYLWSSILTSKGCPMDCSFCSVTQFNGHKFRRRPVDSVVDELATIKKRFVFILDDNLLGYDNKQWLTEFFSKIVERKIKKYYFAQVSMKFGEDIHLVKLAHRAGVRLVVVGIESLDPKCLQSYNKKLNAYYAQQNEYLKKIRTIRKGRVAILGCFILGGDCDDIGSFKKTLDFVKAAHIDVLQLSNPTPLPGTRFFNDLFNKNRIINTDYPSAWIDYTFTRMLFKPENLSLKDVYEGFHYIRRVYYSLPQKLKRMFFTLLDTKSISTAYVTVLYESTYRKSWYNSELYHDYNFPDLKKKFLGSFG